VRGEGSVELSLDEVKDLARKVGFELSVSLVVPFKSVQGEMGEVRGADE